MKLIVEEPESDALTRYLGDGPMLATSRVAVVEVPRAVGLATSTSAAKAEAERLLSSCMLIDVSDGLLRAASSLASPTLRTLDAIHLASALRIEPDGVLAYDRRLMVAAAEHGLLVVHPGVA